MVAPLEARRAGQPRAALWRRALRRAVGLLTSAAHREALWMRLVRAEGQLQPFNVTFWNRYPVIFRFVQQALADAQDLRLLSFGCATGEEVFTLRRYFPEAQIRGLDVNGGNVAACNAWLLRQPDARIAFALASSSTDEAAESYDAIFCMAVLRDGRLRRGVTRCDRFIRFEDFAQHVEDFRRCLKPGGLLVLRSCNFRLCDAPAGAHFETIFHREIGAAAITPIFGPDNRLIAGATYTDTVFRRTG